MREALLGYPCLLHMGYEFALHGVDSVIPWRLTIRLKNVLQEIRLLQGKMSQPPARALTWISRNVAERSKKVVVWTFVTSSVEWLESDWRHGGADVLQERRGANANIEAGEIVLELKPGGGDLKVKTAQPTTLNVENLEGILCLISNCWESSIGPTP